MTGEKKETTLSNIYKYVFEVEGQYMTNEEIRNEINEATSKFIETTHMVNNTLNHAAGRLNDCEQEAYDRGLNDCWEMVCKVYNMTYPIRELIFGKTEMLIQEFLETFTPRQALDKIRVWEEKKKVEQERKKVEKLHIGDVVEVNVPEIDYFFTAMFISEGPTGYYLMNSEGVVITMDKEASYILKKTGEHIDIMKDLKEKL